MIHGPPTYPPFDLAAQERIAALFRKCPLSEFISTLETFTPCSRDEQAAYEKHYGWALYDAGDYMKARGHLLRALRRSRSGSRDRAIIRGLLGECYLRTGRLEAAERCARKRARFTRGRRHYLRAGHLSLLGRVYRRQGHLTHAVDTYRRALSLIDERSSHWTPIIGSLVVALLAQANTHEADALMRAYRRPVQGPGRTGQEWVMTTGEVQIALALGDLDRAERALTESFAFYGDRHGERIWMILTEHRAALCRARKDFAQSERLLRGLLDRCESRGRNGDMVAGVARGLAESLEGLEHYEKALGPARLAMRAGSMEDRMEWAIALHIAGRCLRALGRGDEARRVFQEAMSLHERTQFVAERARLKRTLEKLGDSDSRGASGVGQLVASRRSKRCVRLADD
jgi:tetratricopeptide (TPR) repeat protein